MIAAYCTLEQKPALSCCIICSTYLEVELVTICSMNSEAGCNMLHVTYRTSCCVSLQMLYCETGNNTVKGERYCGPKLYRLTFSFAVAFNASLLIL